ncbi:MAG: DUF1573 domain-containing protein [Sedimentisphaerales bacterium]|nr:DUF1573 domain-containing protein [Sedimentisphaerales bacterium]
MKYYRLTLVLSCVIFTFLFQSGCEEQTVRHERLDPEWFNQPVWQQIRSSQAQSNQTLQSEQSRSALRQPQNPTPNQASITNSVRNNEIPKITFSNLSHDFGKIRSGSSNNICEFVFTNTGNANLIISEVKTSCTCTPVILENDKKEYAPGESGKILAGYLDTELGQAIKHIYIYSNDPASPKSELAIKAELFAPIDYEPKRLNLSLNNENAGCPKITVSSSDGQPFSITGFQSNGDVITAQYNPNKQATQFVLEPQVNMAKLGTAPEGIYKITLSHPECKLISGTFYTPPRFTASPQRLVVSQAHPGRSVYKTIKIVSNYEEDFSIKTQLSSKGIAKIQNVERMRNGYQITVEINPPLPSGNATTFTDNLKINVAGIDVNIQCHGYYPGAAVTESETDGECKTCGPVRIDMPSMSKYPR